MIGAAVANVIGWVKGLFTWAVEKGKTPDGEEWSLIKMISGVFKSAKDWFVGLFTWKKAEPKEGEKEFSVAQLLLDLWEDIKTALSSIFPSLSDLKELLPSFSDVKSFMSVGHQRYYTMSTPMPDEELLEVYRTLQ